MQYYCAPKWFASVFAALMLPQSPPGGRNNDNQQQTDLVLEPALRSITSHRLTHTGKKWKAFSRRNLVDRLHLSIVSFILYAKCLQNFWNLELRKQRAKMYWWRIGPTGDFNSTPMYQSRYLTVKKQFSELICNRLDSLAQHKSVTDTVEIFGYADKSYVDRKAYGERNPFAHPSITATLSPFESCNSHLAECDMRDDSIRMITVCRIQFLPSVNVYRHHHIHILFKPSV